MKHLFQLNTAWKKLSKYDNSLMKSVIQYSEKYVTIGNNGAFYKSLYLLNGKKIIEKWEMALNIENFLSTFWQKTQIWKNSWTSSLNYTVTYAKKNKGLNFDFWELYLILL